MTLRILLAESDTEDVLFLRDVLEEMEGSEYWSGWLHAEVFDAPTWTFAEAILTTETIDVILLSLNLSDGIGGELFRRAQAAAPHVPVVLLIDEHDRTLAERLMRDGAQDFLIKKQVDCEPLAHALRNAIERQKLLAAARASAMTDALTGVLNRTAFQLLAGRDLRIAEHSGSRLAILIAEPRGLASLAGVFGEQQRDLALMETADRLRALAGPTDLVGRISASQFGVCIVDNPAEQLDRVCTQFQDSLTAPTLAVGMAVFNPLRPAALDSLLEQAGRQVLAGEAPRELAHAAPG